MTNKKIVTSDSPNKLLTEQDVITVTYENICKAVGLNLSLINAKTLEDIKYPLIKRMLDKTIDVEEINNILEMTKLLPNDYKKDQFYKDICEIYLRKNDVNNALHVITFIKNESLSVRLLNDVFPLLSDMKQIRKALDITNLINDESTRAITLRNLSISIDALDSKYLPICLYIIDCIPQNESMIKKAALITLETKFLELKENVKDAQATVRYSDLAEKIRLIRLREFNFEVRR